MAAVAGGVRGSERVVAVDVAGRAGSLGGIGMSSGQRPAGRAVIKLSVCPIHRVMAGGALCRRETRSDVIGNGPAKRLLLGPVRLVAAVAIGVGRSQRVVASHVTLRAGRDLASRRHLVRARQRPTGTAVIELAVSPGSDGVATGTSGGGGREVRSDVIRNVAAERLRLVPIGCVAGEAVRGIQSVIIVDVAGSAGRRRGRHVRADKRKAGSAVIEACSIPSAVVVAGGTVGGGERRTRSGVLGIVGLLPGREMATRIAAIVGLNVQTVIAADVALRASCDFSGRGHLVGVRQRKTGGAVIELAVSPGSNGVATGTSGGGGREVRSDVIRNVAAERLRLVPIGCVAGEAVRGIQSVIIVDVAGSAGRRRGRHVRADKSEAGDAVIERSRAPSHGGVALGAVGGRKSGAGGGGHGSGGLLPLGEMAAGVAAIGRLDLQVVIVVDVAGSAGNVGVPVCQKKAGGAVIEFAVGPFGDGVAGGARRRGRRGNGGGVIGDVATEGLCFVPVRGVAGRGVGGRKG